MLVADIGHKSAFERRRLDLPQSLIAPSRGRLTHLDLPQLLRRPPGLQDKSCQHSEGVVTYKMVMVMVALALGQCAFHSPVA